jgi:uncharacterized delta-60 repeat protein
MKKILLLLMLCTMSLQNIFAQEGNLVATDNWQHTGFFDYTSAIAREPGGNLIVAGYLGNTLTVRRFTTDHENDATFVVATNVLSQFTEINTICVEPEGNILLGGGSISNTNTTRIVRITQTGALATNFTPITIGSYALRTIARQSSPNRILVGGFTYQPTVFNALLAYTLSGVTDSSFNNGGNGVNVTGAYSPIITTILINPSNQNIFIGGVFHTYNGQSINPHAALLNSNGGLITSYAGIPTASIVLSAAFDNNNNILIGGQFTHSSGKRNLLRYSSLGALDNSFTTTFNSVNTSVNDIEVLCNGKIVIGGLFNTINGAPRNNICRLTGTGSTPGATDNTFDPGTGPDSDINQIVANLDGDVFVQGEFTQYNGTTRNGLALVDATPQVNIDAVDDDGAIQVGTTGVALYVLYNDIYNGDIPNTPEVTLSVVSAPSGITLNTNSGAVTVASTVPLGTYTLQYSICVGAGSCICDTATATITVASLTVNPDSVSLPPCTGTTFNVLTNDIYNGGTATVPPLVLSNLTVPYGGVSFNLSTGIVTVPNNLAPGNYSFVYRLSRPLGLAKTGSVDVTIGGTATAGNNNLSVFTGNTGSVNVLLNDFYNAGTCPIAATAANTVTASVGTWPSGITISQDGIVTVATTAAVGQYLLQYRMCSKYGNTVCATANILVRVFGVINAVDDMPSVNAGVTSNISLIANDTYNNIAINQSTNPVVINAISGLPAGITYNTSTGIITVASTVAQGTYIFNYTICDVMGGGNCDTATVTLTVLAPLTPTSVNGVRANASILASGIMSNDKIIIAGGFSTYNNLPAMKIAKLNSNLTLDTSFNPVGPNSAGGITNIAIQTNDYIVVIGNFKSFSGVTTSRGITRLLPNGNVDPTFAIGFGASYPSDNFMIRGVALQPDGKIIIVGMFESFNGVSANGIIRLKSDGTVDTSFVVGTGFGVGFPDDVAIQSDGRILVSGSFSSYKGVTANDIVRLLSNGDLDSSFSSGSGITSTPSNPRKITLQPDGKIILYGSFSNYNGVAKNNIVRLNSSGSIDNTFYGVGSTVNSNISSVALDLNGKMYIGGDFYYYNNVWVNKIIRVDSNNLIDSSFDTGSGPGGDVFTITRQPDGKVIIGGNFQYYNNVPVYHVTRINPAVAGGQARTMPGKEEIDGKEITLYPNPSNGVFNIDLKGYDENTTFDVVVHNPLGQLIYKGSISTQGSNAIDLTGHETGNYFITLQNNLETINKVVTVKK